MKPADGAHLPPAARRRGSTLVVAIVLLVVAALIAVVFQYVTRSAGVSVRRSYESEVAYQVGRSAEQAALAAWFARLADPSDPLSAAFARSVDAMALPELGAADHPGLAAVAADFPGIRIRCEGRLLDLSPVVAGGDPLERKGSVRVETETGWHGVHKRLTLVKRFKVANVAPPLVSRFTLFVRESAGDRYNNLDTAPDGGCASGRPLILSNGRGDDLAKLGWIYLGGERTPLNLARGDANFGEDFMLPDEVTRSAFFPDQDYALLHVNAGFYASAGGEPVFSAFPVKNAFRASCLRLFGCAAGGAEASPTLVLGDVWRRYLQAGAIGPVSGSRLGRVATLPWTLEGRGGASDPAIPPFLSLSSRLYQVYMSQVREEPYNRSVDYIWSSDETPPPLHLRARLAGRFPGPYPVGEAGLELRNRRGDLVASGRTCDADPAGPLKPKTSLRFADFASFARFCVMDGPEGKVCDVEGVIRIGGESADLSTSDRVTFTGRACLVFEGPLKLGNVRTADPKRDLLSFVVERGDLELTGSEYQAGLAALGGEVRPTQALAARGFLASGRLDPDLLRRGGKLAYDERFNPEDDRYAEGYALVASPHLFAYGEQ